MNLDIRDCREEDCALVADIILRAYAPGVPADDPYREDLADTRKRMGEAQVLVAWLDGQAVGTITCCLPGSAHGEIARDNESELRMLAVDPARQGRGIGRALLESVIAQARAAGYDALVLSTASWMTHAHRLYTRLGFVHTPERDWRPRPDVALVTYRLNLQHKT